MALAGVDWTGVLLVAFTLAVFAAPLVAMFPPRPVRRSEALQRTHRRLGLRAAEDGGVAEQQRRRQGDVAAAAADDDDGPAAAGAPQVHSLQVYPIKSCRGIEVAQATVLVSGLEYDRLYAFAQRWRRPTTTTGEAAWEVVTQRQLPLLATVKVDVWLPRAGEGGGGRPEPWLVVRFPRTDAGRPRRLLRLLAAKLWGGRAGARRDAAARLPVG